MANLKTFIKEDEEILLKIKKNFRSWLIIVVMQSLCFIALLYIMRYQTEIVLSLISVAYIVICSWILALQMYDKRLITNKKIILLSRKHQEAVKFIDYSQIKRITFINNLWLGDIITIVLHNKTIHKIYYVSNAKKYISHIDELIRNLDTNITSLPPEQENTTPSKNAQGFVYEKLVTCDDINITNITKQKADALGKFTQDDISNSIKKIMAQDQLEELVNADNEQAEIQTLIKNNFPLKPHKQPPPPTKKIA